MLSERIPDRKRIKRLAAAAITGVTAAALLAACSSGGSSSSSAGAGTKPSTSASASGSATPVLAGGNCSSSATHLTFWAWVPGMSRAVTEFNSTHPNICVTLQDPGAGSGEYVPLDNALKAGQGAPDVAEVEFDLLPSYEIQHYLVNLVPYGANKYKSDFASWAWSHLGTGSLFSRAGTTSMLSQRRPERVWPAWPGFASDRKRPLRAAPDIPL